MRISGKPFAASALAVAGLLSGFALFASSAGARAGDINVTSAWSRATVHGASVGVGYLTVENQGKEADRLTGGAADVADKIEVHETIMSGGVMQMRFLPNGLEIKPGATVTLKPGGFHLMLLGLKKILLPGEKIHLTLQFAKAGAVEVDAAVESVGAVGPTAAPAPKKEESPTISY
jgi:hypothetical protein